MKVGDLKIFSLGFGASLPALPNSKGPGRQRTTPAGAALRDAHREIVLPRADDDSIVGARCRHIPLPVRVYETRGVPGGALPDV